MSLSEEAKTDLHTAIVLLDAVCIKHKLDFVEIAYNSCESKAKIKVNESDAFITISLDVSPSAAATTPGEGQ